MPFFSLRFRPSPVSHDRGLLVYAPDLETARAQAMGRINHGAELIRHRWKEYPDARACNNALPGGLAAQLPEPELLAFLEGEWEPQYRARNPHNDRRLLTAFDAEMQNVLNHLRAQQKLRALEDPTSPEARAVYERERKQAELDAQKREQRHRNWEKAREARRNSEESKRAEIARATALADVLAETRRRQQETAAIRKGVG